MENVHENMVQPDHAGQGDIASDALAFDAADYIADIEEFDLTEAEARELLSTLFAIMRAFVELGLQHDVCGQVFGETPALLPVGVDWPQPQHDQTAP